jgi:hypothetical protein
MDWSIGFQGVRVGRWLMMAQIELVCSLLYVMTETAFGALCAKVCQ